VTGWLRFVFFGFMVWIVIGGIRRKGIEGWLALPVILMLGFALFSTDLALLHLFRNWTISGVVVGPVDILDTLVAVVITLLLLRRLLQSVKRQREMALDVKQAQEVQQVILPEASMALPGLTIESIYRPAREVGGDFFQIIPHPTDGSLLVVAGDVAGKGLQAGMLVALLVGAIRSTNDWTQDPVRMLKALNQRLMGRGNVAATCLALRIAPDGQATLANAGHLPPWLNGKEIEIEGALPLGLYEAAEPSVTHFQLHPDDKLVLISDGILEAANESGQLFGFDRFHALLQTATTAAEVAQAAQSFGQNDDISVIALTRTLQPA
jgi:serine phosphatase RsbU (regulator of sigma subunit)